MLQARAVDPVSRRLRVPTGQANVHSAANSEKPRMALFILNNQRFGHWNVRRLQGGARTSMELSSGETGSMATGLLAAA